MNDNPYRGLEDRDAELAVLEVAVRDGDRARQLAAVVDGSDFRFLGSLYVAVQDCWKTGEHPDAFALPPRMGDRWNPQTFREVVGYFSPNPFGAARRVAELAARRRLVDAAYLLDVGARDESVEFADTVADVRRRLDDAHTPLSQVEPGPDVEAFLDHESTPDYVIPDTLERGERGIVTGAEGRGKSLLLQQVAVQAAAGFKLFTNVRGNPPVNVLLVDCENSAGQLRRRLKAMWGLCPTADPHRLVVQSRPEGLDLLHRGDRRWLEERVAANRPDVVVTGPLYKLHAADPNEERPAAQLRDLFDDLRSRYGFALLIEAHQPYAPSGQTKRPARPYGASLWSRWPELGLNLADQDDGTVQLAAWRPMREDRPGWPRKIIRGPHWPWLAA